MLKGLVDQLPHGPGLGVGLGEGHFQDLLPGGVQDLVQAPGLLVGQAHGLPRRLDEPPQGPLLRHDAGVVLGVGGGGRGFGELEEVGGAAHLFQLAPAGKLLGEGHQVHGPALAPQGLHGGVDLAVGLGVEGLGGGEEAFHLVHDVGVQENGAQDALLRLEAVGGNRAFHKPYQATPSPPSGERGLSLREGLPRDSPSL